MDTISIDPHGQLHAKYSGTPAKLNRGENRTLRAPVIRVPIVTGLLPTWGLREVGRYQGYTGRDASIVARAAHDPKPIFGAFY